MIYKMSYTYFTEKLKIYVKERLHSSASALYSRGLHQNCFSMYLRYIIELKQSNLLQIYS